VPEWLVDLFARYGYTVVFVGVLLENAGVPVPGETTLLAGAALAQYGRLSLVWVVLTAIGAAVLGDNIGFLIGRRGGRALAERHGWKVGLTAVRLRQFDRFFERYGAQTVFIARFITGLRVFGAVLAGASGLEWRSFLFYNAAGAIVWSSTIALVGYSLAYSWDTLERWVGRSGVIALAAVVVLALVAYTRWRRRLNRTPNPHAER
jgi:membrane protein DedA with SNARE-associated domain